MAKVVSIVKQSSDDADRVMVKVDGRDSISSDNKEALIAGLKSINVCIGNGDRAGADANSGTTAIGKGKEEEGQRVTGKKRNIDSEGTGAQCAGKSGCDDIHDDGTGSEQTKRKTKSNKKMKREDGATKPKNKKRVRDDFIPTPSTVTPSAKSERDTLSLSSLSSSSPLRGLTVLAYNVNGIRAALKRDLSTYLQRVDADILCLTEVKCEQHECPVDEDEWKSKFGYEHVYWSSSQERKGYAGSAVLSKVKPSSVTYGMPSQNYTRSYKNPKACACNRLRYIGIRILQTCNTYI